MLYSERPRQYTNKTTFEIQIKEQNRYQNAFKLWTIVEGLCLSSFYFGFSLAYISSVSTNTMQNFFSISSNNINVVLGNLIGCLPIGAIIGALLAPLFMTFLSRKNFLLLFNAIGILLAGVIQINNLIILYICRLVTGILVGSYMAITPIYINQLTPVDLQGSYGALVQLHVVIAVVLSYGIGVIFTVADVNEEVSWRFLFGFTGITCGIQSVLLIVNFIPESPVSLIQRGRIKEARQVIAMFNSHQVMEKVFMDTVAKAGNDQHIEIVEVQLSSPDQSKQQSNQKPQKFQIPVIGKAIFLGFQLPFMQQMSGINMIVTQIGTIVEKYDPNSALYAPLVSNLVQLISTLCSVAALSYFGRRSLILFGNFTLGVVDLVVAVLFLLLFLNNQTFQVYIALGFIMVFMIIYGVTIGPTVWLYVPEIIPAKYVPFATALNWVGCSISIIVTPFIVQAVGSSYPVFFIFGGISIMFSVINYFLVIETKGLSLLEISQNMLK